MLQARQRGPNQVAYLLRKVIIYIHSFEKICNLPACLLRNCVAEDISSSPDGIWSGNAPVCAKIACDATIPEIANATHTVEEADKVCGKKAEYKCNECSNLVGASELLCEQEQSQALASWNWATSQPTCKPICCAPLPRITKQAQDSDYAEEGTVVRDIHGSHKTWPEECPGGYVCQQVEAKCDVCFEYKSVDGESQEYAPTRECKKQQMEDGGVIGVWSHSDKECTRKECEKRDIGPEKHAHYKEKEMGTINKCNQTVEVECDCCFKLNDAAIRQTHQCLSSKAWDLGLPTCQPITCPEPQNITNGDFTVQASSASCSCKTVRYQCDPCFRLVGEETLSCSQDPNKPTASWSSDPPRCEPICCEPLVEPIDQVTHLISTTLTHVKNTRKPEWTEDEMSVKDNFETCAEDYVCQKVDPECGDCFEYTDDDGTNINGVTHPPQRTCEKRDVDGVTKGEWTNKDKYCKLKKCPYREISGAQHISYTAPADYDASSLSHCLSNVTVTCDLCFELTDGTHTETHQCGQDKAWSKEVPTCSRTKCPQPPVIEHCTYKDGITNLCDDARELECDECFYEPSCTDRSAF